MPVRQSNLSFYNTQSLLGPNTPRPSRSITNIGGSNFMRSKFGDYGTKYRGILDIGK